MLPFVFAGWGVVEVVENEVAAVAPRFPTTLEMRETNASHLVGVVRFIFLPSSDFANAITRVFHSSFSVLTTTPVTTKPPTPTHTPLPPPLIRYPLAPSLEPGEREKFRNLEGLISRVHAYPYQYHQHASRSSQYRNKLDRDHFLLVPNHHLRPPALPSHPLRPRLVTRLANPPPSPCCRSSYQRKSKSKSPISYRQSRRGPSPRPEMRSSRGGRDKRVLRTHAHMHMQTQTPSRPMSIQN